MKLTIFSHFESKTWSGDAPIKMHENAYVVLERVWRMFNRVDDADVRRLERMGYDLPSLSVGDRVTIEDAGCSFTYVVENVGYSLVGENVESDDSDAQAAYYEALEAEQQRLDAMPRVSGCRAVAESADCEQCGETTVLYARDAYTLGYAGHPGAEITVFQLCANCLSGDA